MTLNHLHLGTKDIVKIQSFYEKYFGFKKKSDQGDGIFLINDKGFLLAIDPVAELPQLPNWYHLGFCLDDETEVKQIYNTMYADQVTISRELKSAPGEFASFYVLDPDGNKIEVSWHND